MDSFAARLLAWFDLAGRTALPWQRDRTPYRVWLSEVMLQQTQVATVAPYFERFVAHFPDVTSLARADLDAVLALWTGLGYYARARNLHAAARIVVRDHGGEVPADRDALERLPGVGRSTAGAILALAFGVRAAILDGNVKRVLARLHAVAGPPDTTAIARTLWSHAEAHTPETRIADYTQAIMDLGALVCRPRNPDCAVCPVEEICSARQLGRVDEFPTKRPRRVLPTRTARMFLLTDSCGRWLLERRPLDGLWGGLWTLPERPSNATLGSLLAEIGIPAEPIPEEVPLASFRHTFSHFHLDIEPVRARLEAAPIAISDGERFRWWSAAEHERIGLAAPVVKLVRTQ
jgi:A/G-specific adenine glycosylase